MPLLSPEVKLRSILVSDSSLSTLIGTKIYPFGGVPQKAQLPWVEYMRVYGDRVKSLNGPSGEGVHTYQIDCKSTTRLEANSICDAVITAADMFGRGAIDGEFFGCLKSENQRHGIVQPAHAGEQTTYVSSVDLYLSFDEEART